MDQDNRALDAEAVLQESEEALDAEAVLQEESGAIDAPLPEVSAEKIGKKKKKKAEYTGYREPTFWESQWKRLKKYRRVLWFIIPAAAFSLVFSYIPMVGVLYSFKDGESFELWRGMFGALGHGSWTFDNYIAIFVDNGDRFFAAIGNTLVVNVIRLLICFPLSIIIAVQLSELKNQALSKTILIILCIPNFLSWAIVISVWWGILDPLRGILKFLNPIFSSNGDIVASEGWFKPLAVIWSAWKGSGWGCIMYFAAIMGIDKSYYESATLEGANRLQKMWYLTIPSILPTIALMLVLNISGMMAAGFEQIWTMMSAKNTFKETQETLDTYIYDISIVNQFNIPFATALGVFNGAIALILMLVGNKITSKTLKRGLW